MNVKLNYLIDIPINTELSSKEELLIAEVQRLEKAS
jgi:hypothetical protein